MADYAALEELEREDGDLSLVNAVINVQGYMFEPRKGQALITSDDSSSDESESDVEYGETYPRVGNTDWCLCGSCVAMPTGAESICCIDVSPVNALREELQLPCITKHPGFYGNCINPYVVETSFFEFLENYGHVGDDEPIHQMYRHVAYRRFTRWVWHLLGKRNRKVIPSCAVTQIRETWPSEGYKGLCTSVSDSLLTWY